MSEDIEQGGSVILWQLQQYQHVIRNWDRHLDAYELKVVMQVLDRTIGWQRLEATFRPHVMLNGDRKYSGFGKTMSRSKLMKVLANLERRGCLSRTPDYSRLGLKSYSINLDWKPTEEGDLAELENRLLDTGNDVSNRDGVVSHGHPAAFYGDGEVSDGDPRETYQDKTIIASINEKTIDVTPAPAAPAQRVVNSEKFSRHGLSGQGINPPLRTRRVVAS